MNRDEYIASLSGRPDRCYHDPWDLTRYFAVSNGLVRERECPECPRNPVICPEGRLRWDQVSQRCLWADDAAYVVLLAAGEPYLGT